MVKALRLSLFLCLFSLTSVAQVNLTNGLVAYYPFNGTLNDASGNGNHGSARNGVTFGADQWGNANNAAYFDGIDDWISVAASPSLTPGREFSAAFRFKTTSSALQLMLSKSDYTTNPHNWQYQVGINGGTVLPNNGLLFATNHTNSCVTTSGFASNYSYGTNTGANQWYCVVVTFNNGVKKIYMNGSLVSTVTVTGTSNNTSVDSCTGGTLRLGTWWQGDPRYFSGLMDEVRVYNRALNTQEIDSLCNLVTPAPAQTIVNKYAAITGYSGNCDNTFVVDTATGFAPGDTVLMIQMKGATIDSSNTSAFGTVLSYNGAGNYEFNVVKAVSGNNITLRYKLNRSYDIPGGKVQLVRAPYFTNYTLSQPHTCMPWNGSKGGIIVLSASGTITMNAPIDVSQRGFRSGTLAYSNSTSCGQTNYYYPNTANSTGAEKGEGIAELGISRRNGRGPQGSGGGGGNSSNGGGAGGGNGGAGGAGGKETAICSSPQGVGGIGGKALTYSNALNKVFMGGGAGAGHANNNEGGNGTPGGGIVILMANQLVGNGQAIISNGGNGNGCIGDCWDGQPGGSAGGSVLLHVNSYSGAAPVSVRGGNGANQEANNTSSGANGPGGGGGGGALWVKGAAMPAQITASLSGGSKGVFLNNGDPWGTTDGSAGTSLTGLTIGFPAIADTFRALVAVNLGKDTLLCPGDTITLNAGNPGSTFLYNTGATTQTLKVSAGGTYSVSVTSSPQCIVRDTIAISNGVNPVVKLGNDTVICPGAAITLNGGAFGSGFTYLYSNSATTQTTNVTAGGTYTLRVTNTTTGCRGRDTIVITQGFNPVVNLGRDTAICPGKTMILDAGNTGSTYLYNTGATSKTITITSPGAYSVRVTNAAKCVGRDTIVVAQGVDPVVDLGPDTTTCYGIAVTLDAGYPGSTYLYSIGTTTQTLSVIPAGTYWVRVTTAQGCVGYDTINVSVIMPATVSTITPVRTGATVAFTSNALYTTGYQWSFGDGTSSTSPSPSHTYTANGTYNVRLIAANDCNRDTALIEVFVHGVGTGDIVLSEADLSLYPNPASSSITLDNRSPARMESVTVLNGLGAVVIRKERIDAKKERLDVGSLAAGIYLVRIQTDSGTLVRKLQILK
jgi:hypothetical protein